MSSELSYDYSYSPAGALARQVWRTITGTCNLSVHNNLITKLKKNLIIMKRRIRFPKLQEFLKLKSD